MFDSDSDGMISSVEFMTNFFRIGSNEKTKVMVQHRREDEKRMKSEHDRIQKKIEATAALATTKVIWPKYPKPVPDPIALESHRDKDTGSDYDVDGNAL